MQQMLQAARYRSRAYTKFSAQSFGLSGPHRAEEPAYPRSAPDDGHKDGAFWVFLALIAGIFSAITALLWWS